MSITTDIITNVFHILFGVIALVLGVAWRVIAARYKEIVKDLDGVKEQTTATCARMETLEQVLNTRNDNLGSRLDRFEKTQDEMNRKIDMIIFGHKTA